MSKDNAAGAAMLVPWFPKQSLWFDRRVQAEYSSLIFCFGESYCRERHFQSRVFEWFIESNKQADCDSKAECSSRQQLPSAQEQLVVFVGVSNSLRCCACIGVVSTVLKMLTRDKSILPTRQSICTLHGCVNIGQCGAWAIATHQNTPEYQICQI